MKVLHILSLLSLIVLVACSQAASADNSQATLDAALVAAQAGLTQTASVQLTALPSLTAILQPEVTGTPALPPTALPSPTPDQRLDPARWADWPVIPTVSNYARQVYYAGIAAGNNPHWFSTVGDCQSEPNVFLGIYATDRYWLGEDFQFMQQTILYYGDAFSTMSYSVRDGLSAPSALDPLWADAVACQAGESPVACELRIHKPAVMFINLGTNWRADASAAAYEKYLRQIVELVMTHGTLPILSTKADNVEGDNSINRVTAQVAHDYDIPLWNFWLAAQGLENGGLDPDRDNVYLTPEGWDVRNFTALQSLDAVTRAVLE